MEFLLAELGTLFACSARTSGSMGQMETRSGLNALNRPREHLSRFF